MIKTILASAWNETVLPAEQMSVTHALESGKVLYFSQLPFMLTQEEKKFLDASILAPKTKNVSYDPSKSILKGVSISGDDFTGLKQMMMRYADYAQQLISAYM